MIFRSDTDKADLSASWHRPDRAFFASGACHILAHAFLQRCSETKYHALYILPQPGFRGSHVIVSNGKSIFDYHGRTNRDFFLNHYFAKMRRFFPGWQAELLPIESSLVEEKFCRRFNHRMPHQFFKDPLPRAYSFLNRLQS